MKTVQVSSGDFEGVLIQVLTSLMDDGLISFGEFEISTEKLVEINSKSADNIYLSNDQQNETTKTYIRLEGYTCTDTGLELCQLYEPIFNDISDLNLIELHKLIAEAEGITIVTPNN